jgi:uncharacterized protein
MSMYPDGNVRKVQLEYATDERVVFNFFNTVYAWMAAGLGVTATVAFAVSQSQQLMQLLFMNKFMIVALVLGAWAIAYGVQTAAMRISAAAATGFFLLYAAVIGALVSYIFIIYPVTTLASAFVLTAGTFGAMSVYGFVTKRDLTSVGSFLVMCAFGLFFASIVNMFIASNAFSWLLTYAILGVFIGLTAYETQMLKRFAENSAHNRELAGRVAIVGSLMLYISFINMFMSILRILGSRK